MKSRDIKRKLGIGRKNLFYDIKTIIGHRLRRINIGAISLHKTNRALPMNKTRESHTTAMHHRYRRKKTNLLSITSIVPTAKVLFFRLCVAAVIFLICMTAWRIVRPSTRVRVSSDTVAAFRVPHRAIGMLAQYSQEYDIPFAKLFAIFNAENEFFPEKTAAYDLSQLHTMYISNFDRLSRQYNRRSLAPYVEMYHNLFADIETFPIPSGWYEHDASVMFGNSWGVEHNFQGNRTHRGVALIDRENIRGRVPIVSMSSGTVTNAGWDNHLGYFVGITSRNGTYFLYAHLENITAGLTAGQNVHAGQSIGQMGNTGGGRNSRSFPVHLHLAISPDVSFTRGDFWINPYPLLRYLEAGR